MLAKLWNDKYSFDLIKSLTETARLGIVAVNIMAPIAIVYIMYDFLEHFTLLVWLAANILFFIFRMLINKQLKKLVKLKSREVYVYLKEMYIVSFLTTVLYGYIIWLSVLENVPDTHVLLIGVIMSGMATGSLVTIGSIFTAYIFYMVPSFLFLISAILYHGGDVFQLFALTMFTMMGLFIISGYRHYEAVRDTVSLDTTFKTLYDNSTDGIIVFQKSKIVSLNKAMVKLFGYDDKRALIKTHLKELSPEYQPSGSHSGVKMLFMIRATLREGYKSFEWLHVDKNGKEFWCEIVLTKIYLNGVESIHGVWRDITNRKELALKTLEDKLHIESLNATLKQKVAEELKLNREKDKQMLHQSRLAQMGEMISMIAHQWRQPLSAIASAGALINLKAQLNKLDKETALETSKNIAEYTQHLSTTINDFRDFFKQDKEREATNFTYLVKSVLKIISTTLEYKNIEVIEELHCNDSFLSYPNELKQVIINFVKNAQDVLVEKKVKNAYVKFKSYASANKYILEVCDNGGGIPGDVIEHIFDPYFSTKLQKDGTGLGLYMSKTIVEDHCLGTLTCYNTDDGACFKIELVHA